MVKTVKTHETFRANTCMKIVLSFQLESVTLLEQDIYQIKECVTVTRISSGMIVPNVTQSTLGKVAMNAKKGLLRILKTSVFFKMVCTTFNIYIEDFSSLAHTYVHIFILI